MDIPDQYVGVYCTRFPYALYRHTNRVYKSELEPGSYRDEGPFTKSMVVDRAREVLGLISEPVDYLLVLTNQDDLNAINDIMNYTRIYKKAAKFKAIPSSLARISYIVSQFSNEIQLLADDSHFSVVECHHGGYDIHVLLKVENNFRVLESTAYKDMSECLEAFNFKKLDFSFTLSVIAVDESVQNYGGFGSRNICKIPKLENMLMEGGFSKIAASIQGSNEVLDFPPKISIEIFDNEGSFYDLILGPGQTELIREYMRRNILGFSILYDDDLCVVKLGNYIRQSKTLVPFQQCAGVRVKATTGKFGTVHLNLNALSEACLEAWIPTEEDIEQMGPDITKQLKMLSVNTDSRQDFWKSRQGASSFQTHMVSGSDSRRVSTFQPGLQSTAIPSGVRTGPNVLHRRPSSTSSINSLTSHTKCMTPVNPPDDAGTAANTVTSKRAQKVGSSFLTFLEFTISEEFMFVKKYYDGKPENPGKSHDVNVPMYFSRSGSNFLIGKSAREMMANQSSDFVLYDISKLIGRRFDEVKVDPKWPFRVVPFGAEKKAAYMINTNNNTNNTNNNNAIMTPVSVLSYIFCHLKSEVEEKAEKTKARLILDGNEFNEEQVIDILIAANLAKLDVFEVEIA